MRHLASLYNVVPEVFFLCWVVVFVVFVVLFKRGRHNPAVFLTVYFTLFTVQSGADALISWAKHGVNDFGTVTSGTLFVACVVGAVLARRAFR